jgi:hypothetical protein
VIDPLRNLIVAKIRLLGRAADDALGQKPGPVIGQPTDQCLTPKSDSGGTVRTVQEIFSSSPCPSAEGQQEKAGGAILHRLSYSKWCSR